MPPPIVNVKVPVANDTVLPVDTVWFGVTSPHAITRPAEVDRVEAMNQPLIVVSDGAEKLPVETVMTTLLSKPTAKWLSAATR